MKEGEEIGNREASQNPEGRNSAEKRKMWWIRQV